jgi:prephenate dehydrogenase
LVDEIVELDKLIQSDMIVLCIPVDAIIAFLPKLIDCIQYNTTIVDFGSTKELIVKSIPIELKNNYIPAHPMTGTEKFGPSAAIDELYENKTMVLCDLESAGEIHKNRTNETIKKYISSKNRKEEFKQIAHSNWEKEISLFNKK